MAPIASVFPRAPNGTACFTRDANREPLRFNELPLRLGFMSTEFNSCDWAGRSERVSADARLLVADLRAVLRRCLSRRLLMYEGDVAVDTGRPRRRILDYSSQR